MYRYAYTDKGAALDLLFCLVELISELLFFERLLRAEPRQEFPNSVRTQVASGNTTRSRSLNTQRHAAAFFSYCSSLASLQTFVWRGSLLRFGVVLNPAAAETKSIVRLAAPADNRQMGEGLGLKQSQSKVSSIEFLSSIGVSNLMNDDSCGCRTCP